MNRILLTGCSGFLGRYVGTRLADTYDVLGTYLTADVSSLDFETVKVDLLNPPFPRLLEYDPDALVHCAALTDVDECERNPGRAVRLNVDATEHVASLAAETGARLLYVSTDSVFDGSRGWWAETDSPDPVNVYGETKLDGERTAARLNDDTVVARTNFFGWNGAGRGSLAEWMIETLASGDRLPGFEDAFFTPLFAGDLATSLEALLVRDDTGVVHLGSRDRMSKYEFAREVAEVFELDSSSVAPVEMSSVDLDAPRGNDLSLDTARAETVLGRRMPDIRTGLERMRRERQ
ncbi:SDR family oxidoreductase [Salinigranum rubrum]|uniref:SDR family oxidoreductase n=1 Tax=Salinigranum rubrum TaxID=755307 RepID=UPI0013A5AAC0|nr:SDR family oxidoreductase [Salinigranum rubrum]